MMFSFQQRSRRKTKENRKLLFPATETEKNEKQEKEDGAAPGQMKCLPQTGCWCTLFAHGCFCWSYLAVSWIAVEACG